MPISAGLVNTLELGQLRGAHYERVITHFHSPFSFDACDSKGMNGDGSLNLACLHDAKQALCANHINLTFVTDHVNFVAQTAFSSLLLTEAGDTPIINGGAVTMANAVSCPDGFQAVMAPGLEGQLLALGMEAHTSADIPTRTATYGADDVAAQTALSSAPTNALVGIPHTESRALSLLQTLNPAFIEIYNLHANLDPKIRATSLGVPPFAHVATFMNYLADPYNRLNADYMFVEFFEMNNVYFQKWNALLAAGTHVTGVGGLDSHQNIFPQKASDGQRLDQHRRMTRFFNNFVLTTLSDTTSIKAAITAGQVFFVVEGFGTPIGLDFHALLAGTTIVEMGHSVSLGGGSVALSYAPPTVIPSFPGMDSGWAPVIYSELHFIDSAANESVVATAVNGPLVYKNPVPGNYRVHTFIYPLHLHNFVLKEEYVEKAYPWIVSNPILVTL